MKTLYRIKNKHDVNMKTLVEISVQGIFGCLWHTRVYIFEKCGIITVTYGIKLIKEIKWIGINVCRFHKCK